MSFNKPDTMSLSLRSAEQTSGQDGTGARQLSHPLEEEGSGSVTTETALDGRSLQVVSPVTPPELLQRGKPGLELTEPPDSTSYASSRLPRSEFAASGQSQPVSDEVFIEKQRAQEEFLSRGGSSQEDSSVGEKNNKSEDGCYSSFPDTKPLKQLPGGFHSQPSDSGSDSTATSSGVSNVGTHGSAVGSGDLPHVSLPEGQYRDVGVVEIDKKEYPEEFKEGQFDCVLIYTEVSRDVQMAINFKDLLEKFVCLEDGRPPRVCILDRADNLAYINSRFKHSEEAMERSTYMFLIITEEFVNDRWAEIQRDECLMQSIDQPDKKWCVVPLHTKKKSEITFKYPFGLRALKGVDISTVVPDQHLSEINVDKLTADQIDRYFLQNITRMFNLKLKFRLDRERKQQFELERWIFGEKERRLQEAIDAQHKTRMMRIKHEKERASKQEAFQRDEERVRQGVADISFSDTKPQAPTSGSSSKDMISKLLALGVSLEVALEIVEKESQKKKQVSPPVGIGQGNTVIHNYGTLQLGNENRQLVNPAATTEEEEYVSQADSGVVYEVSESSSDHMDGAQPGTDGSVQSSTTGVPVLRTLPASSSTRTPAGGPTRMPNPRQVTHHVQDITYLPGRRDLGQAPPTGQQAPPTDQQAPPLGEQIAPFGEEPPVSMVPKDRNV